MSSPTLNLIPMHLNFSLLLLLIIATLLLCYLNHVKTYKKLYVTLMESSFLLNLIVLTAGNLYFRESESGKTTLLCVSVSIVFVEFCGIVVWNMIPLKIIKCLKEKTDRINYNNQELDTVQILDHSDYNDHNGEEQYICFSDPIEDGITNN